MTIATTSSRMAPYAGNGSATAFPVTFPFLDNSHIRAILQRPGEDDADLVLDTDFTLTGAGDASGGTLTFPAAGSAYSVLATGETLHVLRVMPLTQEQSWGNVDALDATRIEAGDDRLTMLAQQLQEQLDRTVTWPAAATGGETDADAWLTAATAAKAAAQAAQSGAETAEANAAAYASQAQDVAQGAHNVLISRDVADCHPQGAITGLTATLAGKSDVGHNHDTDYLGITATATDSSKLGGASKATAATANSIAQRDASGDLTATAFHGSGANLTGIVAVPTGVILPFAAASPPTGFLECDGAALSRTTYAALFGVIGTTWGAGNGSTTFNLPDLRGEFLRGYDHGRGVDSGRTFASSQTSANLSHSHQIHRRPGYYNGIYEASERDSICDSPDTVIGNSILLIASGGSEARPVNVAVLYCIKY